MFDNGATTGTTDADLGKYFIDRNGNGLKDVACVDSDNSGLGGDECYVDLYNNYAEGDLKGTYTQIGASNVALVKPQAKKAVNFSALYDFGTDTAFAKSVDLSVAGMMRDCGECHVGGGQMEYVPVAQGTTLAPGARTELRGNPAIVIAGKNVFNYFIDQYDEDGDGTIGEVLPQNYADTGVMEVDCLMCHLEGYSWDDRTEAIRKGNFDASRVAGAGLGAADNAVLGSTAGAGYGKVVTYDPLMVTADSGNATLSTLALSKIVATPPSANCSTCHFDLHKVDWKKRGSTWTENMAYETEVHGRLGCMGCHTRDDGMEMDPNNIITATPDSPLWTGNATGTAIQGATTLGHDPSKGNAPFSSLWNKNDNNVRTCAGCHTAAAGKTYYGFGGAPDPTARHTQLGLTQTLIQTGGMTKMTGVANGNHLDVISCETCHTKKMGHGPLDSHSLYEWGTGGAMVDATGPDAAGRLTDHENLYVERTMENNMTVAWEGNKIGIRNALVSMFWRDKDDLFGASNVAGDNYIDINADGQDGGMDAVNTMHVRNAMAVAGLEVLTHDGSFDGAEIAAQALALKNYLPTIGIDYLGTSPKLKLSMMGVFFKANHGTTPAANAWGAGGCKDCHGVDKGFYNGSYDLKPRDLDASWVNNSGVNDNSAIEGKKPKWSYVVPYTTVNVDNYSGRDVTLPLCSTYYGPNPRPALPTMGTLGQIGQVCTEGGTSGIWTVYPLGKIKADVQFTDFHPTTWAKGQPGRSIAINAAHAAANTIRTMDRSEGLWEENFVTGTYDGTITGTDGNQYATRAAWVNYLNGRGSNYGPALHSSHASLATGCATCHANGGSDYTLVSGMNTEKDPAVPWFTFTWPVPKPATGQPTCTTECHVVTVAPAKNTVVTARISDKHSMPGKNDPGSNFTVTLDGSASTCYAVNRVTGEVAVTPGTKTYAWTYQDTAPVSTPACEGVTDGSCVVATWAEGGTNGVTLKVTCNDGATNPSPFATKAVAVTGIDIGAGGQTASILTAALSGKTVTLSADALDTEVATVDITWGDGSPMSTITSALDLANFATSTIGIIHTYKGGKTYSISATTTNDGDPNNKKYTYKTDVYIPSP